MMYCKYYQAQVLEKECWFLVAILRSFEHLAFDRTLDKATSTFEFLVPEENNLIFLKLMDYFIEHKIVSNLQELPNRLTDPNAIV